MYTYAFLLPPAHSLELPQGIETRVQVLGTEHLVAAVEVDLSESKLKHLQANDRMLVQAILDHDRVIQTLFHQASVLPLRFGTCFGSQQDLLTHLETNQAAYLETLNRLNGKAEYVLTLIPMDLPEVQMPPDLKGRDYFLAKKQQYQAQVDYQSLQRQEFDTLLQQISRTYRQLTMGQSQSGGNKIYIIGKKDGAMEIAHDFHIWQHQCPHWQLELSGGQPPYHFLGI